jgi:hypothetical protein
MPTTQPTTRPTTVPMLEKPATYGSEVTWPGGKTERITPTPMAPQMDIAKVNMLRRQWNDMATGPDGHVWRQHYPTADSFVEESARMENMTPILGGD